MFFQITSYLKFIFRATNQHGIHSPFVYDLVTKCFYANPKEPSSTNVNAYLSELLKSNEKIKVKDFGAGSKQLNSEQRSIKAIAKNAAISMKRSQLLSRLVRYFRSKEILELGTSLGIGTASLALGNPEANIISLEGCPETARIAQVQLKKYHFDQAKVLVGEFSATLPKVLDGTSFDLIYFDGNHQENATIDYFNQCILHVHNDSVFIFDDIYWSKGMSNAWNSIRNHPRVSVSIDTFRWGLLFFRKEQPKQHFTIRI